MCVATAVFWLSAIFQLEDMNGYQNNVTIRHKPEKKKAAGLSESFYRMVASTTVEKRGQVFSHFLNSVWYNFICLMQSR